MRDGRVRVTTSHRLHPFYGEPDTKPAPSRGLTLMNVRAHRSRMHGREVSVRKQVGDTESLVHTEPRRREEEEM